MGRISDQNCEWFHRPDFAVSELSSSIVENWNYIVKSLPSFRSKNVLEKVKRHMAKIVEPLKCVNTKDSTQLKQPKDNFKKIFNFMLATDSNRSSKVVSGFMEEARKLCSALLLMSASYQTSEFIMQNPSYTKKFVSSRNVELKHFKKHATSKQFATDTINAFMQFQMKPSKQMSSSSSRSSSSYLHLLDTDSEEDGRAGDGLFSDSESADDSTSEKERDRCVTNSKKTRKRSKKVRNTVLTSSSSDTSSDDKEVGSNKGKKTVHSSSSSDVSSDEDKSKVTKSSKKTKTVASVSADEEQINVAKRTKKRKKLAVSEEDAQSKSESATEKTKNVKRKRKRKNRTDQDAEQSTKQLLDSYAKENIVDIATKNSNVEPRKKKKK